MDDIMSQCLLHLDEGLVEVSEELEQAYYDRICMKGGIILLSIYLILKAIGL